MNAESLNLLNAMFSHNTFAMLVTGGALLLGFLWLMNRVVK
jgi:hypothetical protein